MSGERYDFIANVSLNIAVGQSIMIDGDCEHCLCLLQSNEPNMSNASKIDGLSDFQVDSNFIGKTLLSFVAEVASSKSPYFWTALTSGARVSNGIYGLLITIFVTNYPYIISQHPTVESAVAQSLLSTVDPRR